MNHLWLTYISKDENLNQSLSVSKEFKVAIVKAVLREERNKIKQLEKELRKKDKVLAEVTGRSWF